MVLEFLFDLGSPYSYLASTQLERVSQSTGAQVKLVPIVVGGVFKAVGVAQVASAPRLAWMRRDLAYWADRYGVPHAFPASFPTRTILGQRVIIAAGADGAKAMHALYSAYWGAGKDIGDPAVLKATLDAAGLDGAGLAARAEEQPIKDALRQNTDQAVARGVFGVPTFFVGDLLFFGNDRFDFIEAALKRG